MAWAPSQAHGTHAPGPRWSRRIRAPRPTWTREKRGASILTHAQHVVAGKCRSGREASVWACLLLEAAAGAADG